ncbi:ATP-binding protein [uncultured Propionivibrio sp.]|uniref:hybrid sensor histidine kinase/response regulator n=1 Tax=uncultured Propionivibrio sp. TaxID=426737 RepID=UPI0029C0CDAE|nr:ATP-binding protein [uncultured Propionivibrio sp.]
MSDRDQEFCCDVRADASRMAALERHIAELERDNDSLRGELETLRFAERRLKRVLDGADEGFWDWDLVNQRFVVSERFETMFGFEPGERDYTPEKWAEYVHPDDLARASESIRRHIEGLAPSHTLEVRVRTKSGEWKYVLTQGRIVSRDADGNPLMMSGTHIDISARKEAEAQLVAALKQAEKASRDKSRFLASASHDLRQPMQAIRLLVDSLGRTALNAEQQRICHYINASAHEIGGLLNALLDISKLDSGMIRPDKEVIQVYSFVSRIDAEFSALAVDKSLRFNLCFPFGDMAVCSDGKLLMSLMGNLIGNAIKYTDTGGILVAVRRRGRQALVQVWDTGCGIAPEHLDSIFEEYFQVGNPERDRTKGLGLGLAIARRIATLLNTEIVCRSTPGRGSVFEFLLPLADARERRLPRRVEPLPASVPQRPAARHIALVEDDTMVATAATLALESCGMTVTRYASAEAALADPAILSADFFIVDLRLPEMNGIELLDAVQRLVGRPVKAVIMTGDTAVKRIEMVRATSWQVLFKPVDLVALLAAIEAEDAKALALAPPG